MLYFNGPAHSWYNALYAKTIAEGSKIPSRQGLSLELPEPVHIEIPSSENLETALFDAAVQRRDPIRQRFMFSILHGLQKFLGLPDSYLSPKFQILNRYIRPEEEVGLSRLNTYLREPLPQAITQNAPWITDTTLNGQHFSLIDQLHLAIFRLQDSEQHASRRAYIDFNEGYKPRCISSWQFVVRDGCLNMFQDVRSNDLLVGLPNDLISARVSQIILAKLLNLKVGVLHHHATIIQIYHPDCAGIDGISEFKRIHFDESFLPELRTVIAESLFISDFREILSESTLGVSDLGQSLKEVRSSFFQLLKTYIESERDPANF